MTAMVAGTEPAAHAAERTRRTPRARAGLAAGRFVSGASPAALALYALALGAGLGLRVVRGTAARAGLQALGHRGGDDLGQQSGGADRVVVTRDRVVDQVGIAVGV